MEKQVWRAALIDAYTQSGKTWKCFEFIYEKLSLETKNNLILFVTQANNTTSASQIIQRASHDSNILKVIPAPNIYRSSRVPLDIKQNENYMLVDFWHSRNMNNMIGFVKNYSKVWKNILIIVDEVDSGSVKGTKERLDFINNVDSISLCSVKVVFITATLPNLSKSILKVANEITDYRVDGIVHDIVHKSIVEHHFVTPHDNYIGASWFKDTKDANGNHIWKKLVFPKKKKDVTYNTYREIKEDIVIGELCKLSQAAKECTLIITSHLTNDQERMAQRLTDIGYNVTVELNGMQKKNYKVTYMTSLDELKIWEIPFSQIEKLVESGKCVLETALSYILQAALFMKTRAELRIQKNIDPKEYNNLVSLSDVICRPLDFPKYPRVALIAGNLAGRGITIQNPIIDFVCTSFCICSTTDIIQRGATNAQRFGRSCGMLKEIFSMTNRLPVLIATEGIMQDSLSNEEALRSKAKEYKNGTLVSLKDFITKAEWDEIVNKTKDSLIRIKSNDVDMGRMEKLINEWYGKNTIIGNVMQYLHKSSHGIDKEKLIDFIESKGSTQPESFYINLNHKNYGKGLVFERTKNITRITQNARIYLDKINL